MIMTYRVGSVGVSENFLCSVYYDSVEFLWYDCVILWRSDDLMVSALLAVVVCMIRVSVALTLWSVL